jgi:gamma-glutamyl-gamma-aminobutyrate hydrolase PuuD
MLNLPGYELKSSSGNHCNLPVIALPCNPENLTITIALVYQAIIAQNALPLKCNFEPETVDKELLSLEVHEKLRKIKDLKGKVYSLPQELLHQSQDNPHSEIYKLRQLAKEIIKKSDALILPGGVDIPPHFYGVEDLHHKTDRVTDLRRTIFEFALLHEASKRGMAVLGICRGSQLANIYYGGSLHQHVEDQKNVFQHYVPHAAKIGIIANITRRGLKGYSLHHQAYDQIGHELELITEHAAIGKALENKYGVPQIFLQWHPEFIVSSKKADLSENNAAFFKVIVQIALTRHLKKQVHLEINQK